MLQLTRKTDYAIIALSHMARHRGQVCTARDVADRFRIPPALLMNVLKTLCQRDLVRSHRGAKGGYVLARPAEGISLVDVITAVEGPLRFVQCAGSNDAHKSNCDLTDVCPVRSPMQMIHRRMEAMLRQISLADVMREMDECESGVFLSVCGETLDRSTRPCADDVTAEA